MFKKLHDFIFITKEDVLLPQEQTASSEVDGAIETLAKGSTVIQSALAHYCRYCDSGFSTRGATKNHFRLKHKDLYINPIPSSSEATK